MIKSPWATKLTRQGVRDMKNRKPYRTGKLKEEARAKAERHPDGYWTTPVPAKYH